MDPRTLFSNKVELSKWLVIMRQLRPEVTEQSISKLLPWPYKFLMTTEQNNITGVAAYFITTSLQRGSYQYLADIVIDDKHRLKGLGSDMLQTLAASHMPCELDSGLARKEAHRFYEKHGFESKSFAVRLIPEKLKNITECSLDVPRIFKLTSAGANSARLNKSQTFLDTQLKNGAKHTNLLSFLNENPRHRVLGLENENLDIEGILVYEEQNRLSVGGKCLHVSDLITDPDANTTKVQNYLLLELVRQMQKYNQTHLEDGLWSVIFEMTNDEIKAHDLHQLSHETNNGNDTESLLKLNSLFKVTARHFVRINA